MTEILTKIVACCCGNCEAEGHESQQILPLTAEEISQRDLDIAESEAKKIAADEAAAAFEALKASAKAKLIAGQPLTAEEADVLVI